MLHEEPYKLRLTSKKGKSIRIISGISNRRKGVCFNVSAVTTTAKKFKVFCHKLVAWVSDNKSGKVALVLDNLSLHKNKKPLEYLH